MENDGVQTEEEVHESHKKIFVRETKCGIATEDCDQKCCAFENKYSCREHVIVEFEVDEKSLKSFE